MPYPDWIRGTDYHEELVKHLKDKEVKELLAQFKLLIKLMNKYDGYQTYNTPMKLYKDVFNPERKRVMEKLEQLGVEYYTCEHNNEIPIHRICNCKTI